MYRNLPRIQISLAIPAVAHAQTMLAGVFLRDAEFRRRNQVSNSLPRDADVDAVLTMNGRLVARILEVKPGIDAKYIQRGNAVVLHPFNPDYEDLIIRGEELDHLYIAGKVVETKAKW